MTPQSDPPTFQQGDAELIRRAANLTERDFAVEYRGSASGDYVQRLRGIAGRVEAELESGSPSNFTKDDLTPLDTLANNLRTKDGVDPDKSTPQLRAARIAAIIRDRLQTETLWDYVKYDARLDGITVDLQLGIATISIGGQDPFWLHPIDKERLTDDLRVYAKEIVDEWEAQRSTT